MKLTTQNVNYAATVEVLNRTVQLENCDNVVGFPIYGYQAIVGKDAVIGDKVLVFTAETQLSDAYIKANNLYRNPELNADKEKKGYIEENRRVKAVKFRGHKSSALVMPLTSLTPLGIDITQLKEGDSFDTIDGIEICRKYVIRTNRVPGERQPRATKVNPLDPRLFPEHIDTAQYLRNKDNIGIDEPIVVSQKLHGTSGRFAHVPVLRTLKWYEKLLKKFGIQVKETEYAYVAGSRRVTKTVTQEHKHYYGTDIWNKVLQDIKTSIPKNTILFGEIIGWVDDKPIQKGYTYNVPKGEYRLYIYRVASVNEDGYLVDYSWKGVQEFCKLNGLNVVPTLEVNLHENFDLSGSVNEYLDTNYGKNYARDNKVYLEAPVPLSDGCPCDEGVCIRVEGLQPYTLKAKAPLFFQHESKVLDSGEEDIESAESDEVTE